MKLKKESRTSSPYTNEINFKKADKFELLKLATHSHLFILNGDFFSLNFLAISFENFTQLTFWGAKKPSIPEMGLCSSISAARLGC
jgi:hypothetical protein